MTDLEQKRIFSKNLSRIIFEKNKTQIEIAEAIDESPQLVNAWVKGKSIPRIWKLQKLADYLMVDKSELIENHDDDFDLNVKSKSDHFIPVLGKVAAGFPKEMVEEIGEYIYYPDDDYGDFFALRIKGDSMEPRIIDGDIVIVRKQERVENKEIAIVAINGDDATCKKVVGFTHGLMLESLNPSYEPMFYSWYEVETLPVTIMGKVVEIRSKL